MISDLLCYNVNMPPLPSGMVKYTSHGMHYDTNCRHNPPPHYAALGLHYPAMPTGLRLPALWQHNANLWQHNVSLWQYNAPLGRHIFPYPSGSSGIFYQNATFGYKKLPKLWPKTKTVETLNVFLDLEKCL